MPKTPVPKTVVPVGPPTASAVSARPSRDGEARARARNDLPQVIRPGDPWVRRFLVNPRTWLTVALIVLYAVCLVQTYIVVVPDREVPGGTLLGLGHETVPIAARFAAYSMLPLFVLFIWLDRFRSQRLWIWLMTLGWGGCVATYVSLLLNTWAASKLSIAGDGDPASGARAAIYVAPFVEEGAKATVLFWFAILMRYQFTSRLTGIAMAGLSGAGFAFTENIIYYGRAYRFAAQTFGQADPEQVLHQIFLLRGVMTPYGHPLFTSMTGIGVAVAVRAKSKIVRVLAPLAGYLAAAFLHMSFNTTASLVEGPMLLVMWGLSLMFVLSLVIFMVRVLFGEGRLIRARLADYARSGWLPPTDPDVFGRLRPRLRLLWQALWSGPMTFWHTVVTMRALTELAYLRDAMTRGIVDAAGHGRERDLLGEIARHRASGLGEPLEKTPYPRLRRRREPAPQSWDDWSEQQWPDQQWSNDDWAPPASTPIGVGQAPLGSSGTSYSAVDPTWRPPGQ